MQLNKIKRRLYLALNNHATPTCVKNFLILVNQMLFHWKEREHTLHPGSRNPEKTYFVIRPSGKVEGLLSLYSVATFEAWKAQKRGFIPYIDYENYPTQYKENKLIHGTKNAWEYYFNQPFSNCASDILQAKNVILSGWHIKKNTQIKRNIFWQQPFRSFCQENFGIQPYIMNIVRDKKEKLKVDDQVLAVFLRGTDYVRLKPKGHARQPSPEVVIEKAEEFLKKYRLNRIFLVTEDRSIYKKFQEHFGNIVFTSDDHFVEKYDGKDYVADSLQEPPYERGLNYLIRILLMMECQYLVSSIASGSIFALNMKREDYKASYIFDLGDYA